ncbi:Histone H2A [Phytophthora nicotianae]|uniref:Histone H2A n=1 Tax=Phytophthora nicotianae TaxID=4792 RepID=A0A0W8DNE5_PHYNI|nr:Histone H2A [Phytophthora nicotianae]
MRVPSPSPATASPRAKSKVKTNKRSGKVPPPVVTDLPPRPASGSVGSTPRTQPQTPTEETQRKDRVGKRIAANLTAEQVLVYGRMEKRRSFVFAGKEWRSRCGSHVAKLHPRPENVPEIVEAYEEQLYRNRAPNEAVSSAMSELHRDAQSKFTTKKRKIGKSGREDQLERRKRQPSVTRSQIDGEHPKEKRLRVATNEEEKRHDADGDNASENDFQFEMEEAELHEYADEEFADKLNN